MKSYADRGKALEESLRKDALESMSDEDREFAEDLSTEKLLKFAKRSKNVVQTDESVAAKRAQDDKHPYKDMDKKERQGNWQKVLDHYMN